MRSLNVAKDSHFALVKGYSLVRSIEDTVGDVESPYILPRKELSEAQALLHSDFSACNRHLKKAFKLYQQEVVLARRYNPVKERIAGSENQDLSMKNNAYVEAIRSGKYREAGKILDEMLKMNIPEIAQHLTAVLSEDRRQLVLMNRSSTHITVSSVSVKGGSSSYGGGFRGRIMPGESVNIPIKERFDGSADVHVSYFVNGKSYNRNFKVGA